MPLLWWDPACYFSPPQNSPLVPLIIGGWPLDYESEGVGIIVHAISLQDFQPMWSQSTRTDDNLTCDGNYRALHAGCLQFWKAHRIFLIWKTQGIFNLLREFSGNFCKCDRGHRFFCIIVRNSCINWQGGTVTDWHGWSQSPCSWNKIFCTSQESCRNDC